MNHRPTIKDIARIANVHFTTVSMAMRGHPSIPAATRERILGIAHRIGYTRNEVFAALTQRRSRGGQSYLTPRIAYLANESPEEGFFKVVHNNVFLSGAKRQAEALGYGFELLFVAPGHHDSASLDRYLKAEGIRGLVVGSFVVGRSGLDLDWNEYSVVRIDSGHLNLAVPVVSNDQFGDLRLAFAHLRQLGYRRIGLAVGQADVQSVDGLYLSALLLEQQRLPEDERVEPLIFPLASSYPEVIPLLRRWLSRRRPDVVLCNWLTIREMIGLAGWSCPDEVACACLCLTKPDPNLAGIVANLELVGEHVVSQLAAALRAEQRGIPVFATSTYVLGTWTDGASAPARPSSP